MERSSFHLLLLTISFFCCGLFYFLLLPLQWPPVLPALLTLAMLIPAWRYTVRALSPFPQDSPAYNWRTLLPLLLGMAILTRAVLLTPAPPGNMDSLRMWNYYARFLTLPEWRQLFSDTSGYPATHPPGLPAGVAFVARLLHTDSALIPIAISYLFVLLTVILLYLETGRQNMITALLGLLLFVTSYNFTGKALAQCADAPMGLLLLGVFICTHHFHTTGKKAYLLVTGALLGCCIWLKNEGLAYALFYLLCYMRTCFGRGRMAYTLSGFLPFAAMLLYYKAAFAMPNAVLLHFNGDTLHHYIDRHYYATIFRQFGLVMRGYFYPWQTGLVLYMLACLAMKKRPQRAVLVITGLILLALSFYFITPANLEWQLDTSLERVLSQLMPALTYVLITGFGRMNAPAALQTSSARSQQ